VIEEIAILLGKDGLISMSDTGGFSTVSSRNHGGYAVLIRSEPGPRRDRGRGTAKKVTDLSS